MHTVRRALGRDGERQGDIVPINRIRRPVNLVPKFSDAQCSGLPNHSLDGLPDQQVYYVNPFFLRDGCQIIY
jgi:hypothetical protein